MEPTAPLYSEAGDAPAAATALPGNPPAAAAAMGFPAPSAPTADGANFAAYLDDAATEEAAARGLLVDAQRRYSGMLEGGRLSYRRVKRGDVSMWRLRLSGLTRERAERV